MLTYNFENIGSDTLYGYLYKCIKNDIIQGRIKSGEKLPSKRALAKNLAVSVITVENAYAQLAAEGYIHSVPKSGFYASDLRDDRMNNGSINSDSINNGSILRKYTVTSLVSQEAVMPILRISPAIRRNKAHFLFLYGPRPCVR